MTVAGLLIACMCLVAFLGVCGVVIAYLMYRAAKYFYGTILKIEERFL